MQYLALQDSQAIQTIIGRGMIPLSRKNKMTVLLSVLLSLLILLSLSGCNGASNQGASTIENSNLENQSSAPRTPEQAAEYDKYHGLICEIFAFIRGAAVYSDSEINTLYRIFPSPETESRLELFGLTMEDVEEMFLDLDRMKEFVDMVQKMLEEASNMESGNTTLTGKYYFVSTTDENGEVLYDLSLFEDVGEDLFYLEFLNGNKVKLVLVDFTEEMMFIQDGNTVTYINSSGPENKGTIDGNKVTMETDSVTVLFEKR